MRLLNLEFQALGPFAGHHSVDFREFEPSGLYLLRGQTGAGKSTIIDAITFALYGRVAGGSTSTPQRLRSNYAPRDVDTFVRLQFESSHGTFEVTRRPSYLKEGNKTETPGTATLVRLRLDSEGSVTDTEEVASGINTVNDRIPELVGLGPSQFLQTVILPQGKFADFIHSSAVERKDVLEDIFGTEHFRRFTESLKEQAKDAQQRYGSQRDLLILQAQEMAPEIEQAVTGEQFEKAIGLALEAQQVYETELASCALDVVERQATYRELDATEDERERIVAAIESFQKANATLAELAERADQHSRDVEQLKLAREAQKVASDVAADKRARQALEDAQAKLSQAGDDLADADRDVAEVATEVLDDPDADRSPVAERLEELTRELTRIEAIEAKVERKTALETAVANREQERQTTATQASSDEAVIKQFEPAVANVKQQIEDLNKVADLLSERQTAESALKTRHTAALEADAEREKLKDTAEQIGVAKRELASAREDATNALAGWLSNSALELASRLVDGEPCLVCGSTTHPDTFTGEHTDIDSDQVRRAQDKVKAAEVALESAQSRQRDLTAHITELNQKAQGDSASLEIALSEAQELTAASKNAIEQARELTGLLETARKQADETRERMSKLNIRLAEIAREQERDREEIAELNEAIEKARADFESVAERRASLTARRDGVRTLDEALRSFINAHANATSAQESLTKALSKSRFKSVEDALAATMDNDAITLLDQSVRDYDLQRKLAESDRGKAQATGLLRETVPFPLTSAVAGAREKLDTAHQAYAIASKNLTDYQKQVQRLRSGIDGLIQLQAEQGPLRLLAEKAQGAEIEERGRIPFDTWVIMRQFERVLAAANPYLTRFSSGRYELRRVALDSTSRAQKGGLGLSVFDFETDDERAPHSLSGGETFYCSLALALGLVEVVSSEAGGVNLKSMLIDEGFGSLDAETLDQVMIGLERLRDSGRTVGVVSHVAEMQRRINDGISITALPEGGSTLRVNASGGSEATA